MGDGAAGSPESFALGFDGFEDAGVLYAGEVVENLRFLAERRVRRHRFAGQRNRARSPQVFGEHKAQRSAFQPQEGDFVVLHLKNLGQNHAQIQRRHSLAQHRSQGEEMLGKDDFFHHPVIDILGHR